MRIKEVFPFGTAQTCGEFLHSPGDAAFWWADDGLVAIGCYDGQCTVFSISLPDGVRIYTYDNGLISDTNVVIYGPSIFDRPGHCVSWVY